MRINAGDFSDIHDRRKLIEKYGDENMCFHGNNAEGEDVELHIAKSGIIVKTYQSNGFVRVNTYEADGNIGGETFEGRWK